ncbi:MAG: polynucleotide adenylyltransferase PcnB [Planctomycetota bacterium]|nr:polynucleotide adenylyltransferase PcnB [Planctomycetota bacterium]
MTHRSSPSSHESSAPGPEPRALPTGQGPRVLSADSIPRDALDADALRVVARLEREGFEAYLVGGCVRDLLVGRTPKDFDVATSAHPRQIKRLFRNARVIGRRFKLVHVVYGQHIVETATFRSDPLSTEAESELGGSAAEEPEEHTREALDDLLITEDNEFGTAEQDARRRDFTVNGLFLDPMRNVILDYVGGIDDLERNVLRTIGDPRKRMAEDPVRILRAIKFATRLGFRIDERTWEAMIDNAPRLARSAPPRVLEEILRLMRSGTALGSFRMLRACGALSVVLPAVDQFLGDPDDAAAQPRAETFWRLLEALDSDVHQGFLPTTAVCIALLYLRIIEREADPATREGPGVPPDLLTVTGEVLEPIAFQTRLPRKDTARAQRIVFQQRRFTQVATKRFRPLLFLRSEDFPEALELFRLRVSARGQGWDLYEGWRDRYRRLLSAPPSEVEAEFGPDAGPAPRRRRRRGRRPPPA